jgi:hypothetical protein
MLMGGDHPSPYNRCLPHSPARLPCRHHCAFCLDSNQSAPQYLCAVLQGCTAVHKLKDNLKIFTELAGPVFPPRDLRSNYLVQVPALPACC